MPDESQHYLAFLVRLWTARIGEQTVWRASLEDAHTGQRHGFKDLVSAIAFLNAQITAAEREPEGQAPVAFTPGEPTHDKD